MLGVELHWKWFVLDLTSAFPVLTAGLFLLSTAAAFGIFFLTSAAAFGRMQLFC